MAGMPSLTASQAAPLYHKVAVSVALQMSRATMAVNLHCAGYQDR